MQSFTDVSASEPLISSRAELLANDETIMSNSSGTAFPTTNLQVGMLCYRTDLYKLYQLTDTTPTWVLILDVATGWIANAAALPFTPAGNIVATTTQAAIVELDTNKSSKTELVDGAYLASILY